ncbi:MAG: glucuronate isomerase [Opitutales bacterium]
MSSSFIHPDFMLGNPLAQRLFHDVAADLPIIDFHCHLDPKDLAENRRFTDLTELWIATDPYKHRAMRIAGVPEAEITGNADPRQKFQRWAETVPLTAGNVLHAWTHLELSRFFDIDLPLTPETAEEIWTHANARLNEHSFRAKGLLNRCNVQCIHTSDRPGDDLVHHRALAESTRGAKVFPSLRADDLLAVSNPGYNDSLHALGVQDKTWEAFTEAVTLRLDAFDTLGCRLADHGLDTLEHHTLSESETAQLWETRMRSGSLDALQTSQLQAGLLQGLCKQYARRGWTLQLHLGALRETSDRLRREAGPAGGYAAIRSEVDITEVAALLNALEANDALPRTILYPLNPAHNIPLATLSGSFVEAGVPGKVSLGPAWWYNDHVEGMRATLDAVANYSLLAAFPGMTTDSRSLLSMVRHELFRRVLCSWISERVEQHQLPDDPDLLKSLVTNLSHQNAELVTGQ